MYKMYNGYVDEVDNDGVIAESEQEKQQSIDAVKAVKTKNKPRADVFPTCRYCGKQSLPTAPYDCQADADEAATITCDCFDARQYQQRKEQAEKREKNIIKLTQTLDDFAGYCEARNTELGAELHNVLLQTGIAVLDGIIATASVKFRKMKVNIGTNNKGNIVIGFTYSDGSKVEVL